MQVGSMGESKARASESKRKQMEAIQRCKNESKFAHEWLMNSGNQTKFKPFLLNN